MRTAGAALLALCLPAFAAAAPPIETFTNFSKYQSMKVSPDGKHIALTRRTSEQEILTVLTFPDLKVSAQRALGRQTDVARFDWVTNERLLVEPARRFPGFTSYKVPTGELLGINADGTRIELLFGFAAGGLQTGTAIQQRKSTYESASILRRLRDSNSEVLIQTWGWGAEGDFNAAYRMDLFSGRLSKVASSPVRNGTFVTDVDARPNVISGEDKAGSFLAFYRPDEGADWKQRAKSEPDTGGLVPIASQGTKGEFFALENRSAPTLGVVAWSPATSTEKLLFRSKEADVTDYSLDPDDRPWVFSYTDHFPEYWYPDPEHPLAQAHKWLRGTFKGDRVHITSATDDMSLAIAQISSPVRPDVFLIVDVKNRRLIDQLPSRPDLQAKDLARVEPFEFLARDGLKIRGYLTVPKGADKKLPMIVMIHGGPHGPFDDYGFDYEAQLFASRGYLVLQVNYRGSGGRGREFEGAGFGRWGREIQDDITDGVRWAIGDGIADPQRICAYGASFGAYAALTGAYREPELFRCVVGLAGVYDLPLMFEEGDIQSVERGVNYLKQAVGTDVEELKRRSPVYSADKIKARVMLLHGKLDERAPFEHAVRMRDALIKAGNRPEMITEWQEAHGFFGEGNRLTAYTQILEFFAKHLPPSTTTAANTAAQ